MRQWRRTGKGTARGTHECAIKRAHGVVRQAVSERGAAQPLAATNAGEWLRRRATGGFRGGVHCHRRVGNEFPP